MQVLGMCVANGGTGDDAGFFFVIKVTHPNGVVVKMIVERWVLEFLDIKDVITILQLFVNLFTIHPPAIIAH